MKKEDLRTGMVVETEDGVFGVVANNYIGFKDGETINLVYYSNNLKSYTGNYDIKRIYEDNLFDIACSNLLWERREKKYYLRSKIDIIDEDKNYLNYIVGADEFMITNGEDDYGCQTIFTDKEIEELQIPLDQFIKEEVK